MSRRTSVSIAVASLVCLAACSSDRSAPEEMTSSTPPTLETAPPPASTQFVAAEESATTTTTTTTATTTAATVSSTTQPLPTSTPYAVPVADADAGWGSTHAGYPATDIFAACGEELVSPVDGTVLEVRLIDGWDPAVDNPATRGGRSVALLGDDGVRYYLAHMDQIDPGVTVGARVGVGDHVGTVGRTGRTSACHLHFSISPPCPGKEWSVRRGVVWPYPYLDAWRAGEQWSPADEVAQWVAVNPDACALAMADPDAPFSS